MDWLPTLLAAAGASPDSAYPSDGINLLPMLAPLAEDEFSFSRAWLRSEAVRLADLRSPAYQLGRQLNLPPSYLLIHRVTFGSIGVLCQLDATAPFQEMVIRYLPGFADEDRTPGG